MITLRTLSATWITALAKGNMLMKKTLSIFLITFMALGMQQVQAQDAATAQPKKVVKKADTKKAQSAKKAQPAKKDAVEDDEDDKEPDTSNSSTTEFNCELGNKLTIYHNDGDNKHIALRWKTRLHRMTRVDTSTGANRFENRKYGLVWIDIPAKGMLLDSKKSQQLANECKNPQQMTLK
jgi:hypothetical protein